MTDGWLDSNQFWRDKRVLVTGGAGFLAEFILSEVEGYVVRSSDGVYSERSRTAQERERGAAEIIPSALLRAGSRSSQYDPSAEFTRSVTKEGLGACLRDISAIRRLFHDVAPKSEIRNCCDSPFDSAQGRLLPRAWVASARTASTWLSCSRFVEE